MTSRDIIYLTPPSPQDEALEAAWDALDDARIEAINRALALEQAQERIAAQMAAPPCRPRLPREPVKWPPPMNDAQ